ncbi:Mitogen-activated protein kinase kinase kinase A [Spatholobus suberectus]|nr:Mitogen-activated protein kinase kinase kinase A [Spatholobus suberectus]
MASSWVRGKCVGKGAFGVVNIAVSKIDGGVFAVKSVDRKTGLPGQVEALENEIRVLKRVASPHVVAYLGDDVTCEDGATSSFRNLHLEYMPGGTVADLAPADVDERSLRRYAWCLVSALRDVHARGVVHCDVKGRNVLLAGDGSVAKLADFGAAVEFDSPAPLPRGSPMWMAPEVVRRERQGPESDLWSLGCTVVEMVTGKPAWEDRGVDTLSRIAYSDELPEFPSELSELGRDFLEKCLRREPSERWSCDQLLQHPFLLPYNRVLESSPRCVLDWVDSEFAESDNDREESEVLLKFNSEENSVKNRISKLATVSRANWETQGWVVVREIESNGEPTTTGTEGVNWEFSMWQGLVWKIRILEGQIGK